MAHTRIGFFSALNFLAKVAVKTIEQIFPLEFAVGNLIEVFFHGGGKAIVHQIIKVFIQAVGDNITNLFGKNTLVLNAHIAAILNG